jgi:tRNA (adenine57-N1/adenine58-N1)-methyltransferase catalytic subunit
VAEPAGPPSGVRRGPLEPGERITLTDPKGRRHSVVLAPGGAFHTTKGAVRHDELIGGPEGVVVVSAGGTAFLALRPLLNEFTVTMPRGAAVVYPKDAARILVEADIFPGARVVEAGAGSGALTCYLLRAVGEHGRVSSYERREDFAAVARRNVEAFFSGPHPAWQLQAADLVEGLRQAPGATFDRALLDMLAPWECVEVLAGALEPGGMLAAYVATTTQLGRMVETLRVHGGFTEPEATETLVRAWHAEGLAVRPRHDMVGHTGFLITARRLAPGVTAPLRKRRPAPGAYGDDYSGPRPEPR